MRARRRLLFLCSLMVLSLYAFYSPLPRWPPSAQLQQVRLCSMSVSVRAETCCLFAEPTASQQLSTSPNQTAHAESKLPTTSNLPLVRSMSDLGRVQAVEQSASPKASSPRRAADDAAVAATVGTSSMPQKSASKVGDLLILRVSFGLLT